MSYKHVFIYQWVGEDVNGEFIVRGFGVNKKGEDVYLHVRNFMPWLSLETKSKSRSYISNMMEMIFKGEKVCHIMDFRNQKKLYFDGNQKLFRFYPLLFDSMETRKKVYFRLKTYREKYESYKWLKIHEYEASPLLQFLCKYNLPSCGWIEVCEILQKSHLDKFTRYSKEYTVDRKALKPIPNDFSVPSMRCLSFDLETYSSNELKLPNYNLHTDVIFQIGVSILEQSGQVKNILFTLSPKPITVSNTETKVFPTERELLLDFCKFVKIFNPHVMFGYNIFGFDIPYLYHRCRQKKIAVEEIGMPADGQRPAVYKEIKWSSSAYSVQEFHFLDFLGRISIDLLPVVKRDYKLNNYKLATVSTFFLGETKDPLTVKDIFEAYRIGVLGGNLKKIKTCGKYCVQDARLVMSLYQKLQIWIGLQEMAKICNVGIMTLYTQGQQIKVFSQVYKKCLSENRMVDSFDCLDIPNHIPFTFDNYCGAFVFPPIPGKYEWVIPFDFTSLYPTTLIAYNIDYSTLVTDQSVPDSECHLIRWKENDQEYFFRFRKEPLGVIPSLLQSLLHQRNMTKKELKNTKDDVMKIVLNERQKAYKVSANSMYGAMGVTRGYLPFLPGAMCTTAMGRESIQRAAAFVQEKHGGDIIYGDSVEKNCVLYIQYAEKDVRIHSIEDYFQMFGKIKSPFQQFKILDTSLHQKERIDIKSDHKIFTHRGWAKIIRVIRHKCNKTLYKIYTSSGSVTVTEDHSLLLKNGNCIQPSTITVNEHQLMTIECPNEISDNLVYQKESWDGFFTQQNGKVCFDSNMNERYMAYIFFYFQKHFPNCKYVFKNDIYYLDLFNKEYNFPTGLVLKIEQLPPVEDFVYDIETEYGSFHAGNGNLIVKNTDSIYCHFPNYHNPKKVWKKAKDTEKEFLDIFPPPMKLLFEEKIYRDFLILTKKRYMAYTCDENGTIDDKMTIRGVLLARRDNCLWIRTFYETIVRLIMETKSVQFQTIVDKINDDILKLLHWDTSNTDIHQFIITKTLNEDYKVKPLDVDEKKARKRLQDLNIDLPPTKAPWKSYISHFNKEIDKGKSSCTTIQEYIHRSKPAHVQLALRMEKRGLPISTGSRMEFVIVQHHTDPNGKLMEKMEDPTYFCQHCDILRLDRLYYVKSIVMPLDQLIETVFKKKNVVKSIYDHHCKHAKFINQWNEKNNARLTLFSQPKTG